MIHGERDLHPRGANQAILLQLLVHFAFLERRWFHKFHLWTGSEKGNMKVAEKLRVFTEVWGFMRKRKKYWLGPIFLFLLIVGLLIVVGESSGLGPFVYPFF